MNAKGTSRNTRIGWRAFAAGIALASSALALPAGAAPSQQDRAAADALYAEASKLMDEGRDAEACPKLVASNKLDPAFGAHMKLGVCYLRVGQTASAWASFHDAEAMARKANDKRAEEAALRARELDGKLSKLLIQARVPAPGLTVRRDGTLLDPGTMGAELPVDPGPHTVEAEAPGKQPWKATVRVGPGPSLVTVEIPDLVPAPAPVLAGAAPAPVSPPPEPVSPWNAQRIAGLGVGGAGLVGVALGAVFGAQALGKKSDAKAHCSASDPALCDQAGVDLFHEMKSAGTLSTALFAAGGAMVVGGAVLFLTAPSPGAGKAARRVWLSPVVGAGGGARIEGTW